MLCGRPYMCSRYRDHDGVAGEEPERAWECSIESGIHEAQEHTRQPESSGGPQICP